MVTGTVTSVSYMSEAKCAIHHEISISQNGSVPYAVRNLFERLSVFSAQSSGIKQSSITVGAFSHQVKKILQISSERKIQSFFMKFVLYIKLNIGVIIIHPKFSTIKKSHFCKSIKFKVYFIQCKVFFNKKSIYTD